MSDKYYKILDAVLGIFYNEQNGHLRQAATRGMDRVFRERMKDDGIHFHQGYLNDLEKMGLVTHNGRVPFDSRVYFLTQLGLQVLNEGGVSEYFQKLKDKEVLENKILKATDQSHRLNKIQMIVTIILAAGTIVALLLQYMSYRQEKEKVRLEIEKLKIELRK